MASRKAKPMPEHVAKQLTAVERIKAHFEDSYELTEEDQAYLHEIDLVLRITYAEPDRNDARAKVRHLFPKKNADQIYQLISDTNKVYGDYFNITKDVMRIIQEKRHTRVYLTAVRQGDNSAANRALTAIDKLHDLYTPEKGKAKVRELPKIVRTNDPAALKEITGTDGA